MTTKKPAITKTTATGTKRSGLKLNLSKKKIIWICIAVIALGAIGWYSWWRYTTIYHPNVQTKDEAYSQLTNIESKLSLQGALIYNKTTSACSNNDRFRSSGFDIAIPIITPLTNPVRIGLCGYYLTKIFKDSGPAATILTDADSQITKAGFTQSGTYDIKDLLDRERERLDGSSFYGIDSGYLRLNFFPYDDTRFKTAEVKNEYLKLWLKNYADSYSGVTLQGDEYLYGIEVFVGYRQPLFFDSFFKH